MSFDKIVRRSATAVGISLVLVVLATILVFVVPPLRALFVPLGDGASAYPVGTQVDLPSWYYDRADHTLLIFARSSCGACQRAKPLLSKLVERVAAEDGWSVWLLSTGSDQAAEGQFADDIGLARTAWVMAPRGLRLKAVPTALVVDRKGRVVTAHEGIAWTAESSGDLLRLLTPR